MLVLLTGQPDQVSLLMALGTRRGRKIRSLDGCGRTDRFQAHQRPRQGHGGAFQYCGAPLSAIITATSGVMFVILMFLALAMKTSAHDSQAHRKPIPCWPCPSGSHPR